MQPFPGFVGPSYTSESKIAADDQLFNWYPEKVESGTGPAQWVLYPCAGSIHTAILNDAPFRGAIVGAESSASKIYVVVGTTLYKVVGPTPLATIDNFDNLPVTMALNGQAGGNQIMITSSNKLYCFDIDTLVLTTVTTISANFNAVVFIDGYFVALDASTSTIYLSALEDGTSWDPLDLAQRNDAADNWNTMIVAHKEIWLFGRKTTSVYYDSGDAGFPFIPNPSANIQRGCDAQFSVALLNGFPIWLGDDLTVRWAQGYDPVRISNHAVENAIRSYSTTSDARGSTFTENGHQFYMLTFPTANATWVFDATTGLWWQRGKWNGTSFDKSPVWGHVQVGAYILAGTFSSDGSQSIIYQQTIDSAREPSEQHLVTEGQGMRRVRRAPHLVQTQNRIRYSHFRLQMEVGLGLTTGQGSDPQVMLRWSDDGGQTFGAEYLASAGVLGAYRTLVDWWQLGQGRDRVFEVSVSDPIPWRLVQAFLQTSPGPS